MRQIYLVVVSMVRDALPTSAVVFPVCMLPLARMAMWLRAVLVVRTVTSTTMATLTAIGSSRPSPHIS